MPENPDYKHAGNLYLSEVFPASYTADRGANRAVWSPPPDERKTETNGEPMTPGAVPRALFGATRGESGERNGTVESVRA